jgi:MSHA biogenesis protein MshQ
MGRPVNRRGDCWPNAAGQSIELNRVEQGSTGATGVKTATASANADSGATHILTLRPAPVIVTPGRFNAYDGAPAGINGVIATKIAGSAYSLAVVAVNAVGTAVEAGFSGDVKVEVVDAISGGPVDAANCNAAWPVVATVPLSWTVSLTNGVGTVAGVTVANAFPNLRLRMIYPTGATYAGATAKGCSTDNFAMRPNAFASFSVTDNDWQTAGITRALANTGAAGGNAHKAGRPFTVRADAVNSAAAITTSYAGSPTANLTVCAGTACMATFGTLSLTTTFAAGQLASNTATYTEAGSFNLQLVDSSFAAVDAADTPGDCTATGRYVCSAMLAVGRFVPDNFDVTAVSAPQFRTFNTNDASCTAGAPTRSFTYIGQRFGYFTVPTAMVTAREAGGGTTANYTGALWKLSSGSVTQTIANSPVMTLDITGVGAPSLNETAGTGTGTYGANAADLIAFTRDNTAPQPQFNANLSLTVSVADASEAGPGQGTIATTAPLVFGGIAFDSNNAFRYGRLRLGNANGSQLVNLPVLVETQYWNGTAFVTNAADNCTSIAAANEAMGNYTNNLSGSPTCETALGGGGTLSAGRRTLRLAAPGSGNNGSVDLTVNLGAVPSGNTCTTLGGAPVPATTANLPHLQGNWTGGAYNVNPPARATFGIFKGAEEVIFVRENF